MDARQVGVGALLLAASGAMLIQMGETGGRVLLGLAGLGVLGVVANGVLDRAPVGRWPI